MGYSMSVKILDWPSARSEAERIRTDVFVIEQHVPAELEMDSFDEPSDHALALLPDGRAIGTGRLLPDGHIGRMAVLAQYRGHGVGRALLDALITHAALQGMQEVVLNAQTHAAPFYAKAGFRPRGEVFMEAGIPHVEMWRSLD